MNSKTTLLSTAFRYFVFFPRMVCMKICSKDWPQHVQGGGGMASFSQPAAFLAVTPRVSLAKAVVFFDIFFGCFYVCTSFHTTRRQPPATGGSGNFENLGRWDSPYSPQPCAPLSAPACLGEAARSFWRQTGRWPTLPPPLPLP